MGGFGVGLERAAQDRGHRGAAHQERDRRTITSTNTMMTTPTTSTFLPQVGPRLDFDERTDGQLGDGHRRARRPVVAERLDVDLVHHA